MAMMYNVLFQILAVIMLFLGIRVVGGAGAGVVHAGARACGCGRLYTLDGSVLSCAVYGYEAAVP
ncbi:MAG: hypothetical protein FWD98_07445 [Defluviitaleaceae bacterium]|nr:hypothetical protein [Defluviitaleaceae bacterium]